MGDLSRRELLRYGTAAAGAATVTAVTAVALTHHSSPQPVRLAASGDTSSAPPRGGAIPAAHRHTDHHHGHHGHHSHHNHQSPAAPSPQGGPVLGADRHAWGQVTSAIGGLRGERCYAPPSAGVPGRWWHTAPGVTIAIGSLRPNISDLLAGRLDARLHAFARRVPRGSAVTCWHEGEEHAHGAHVPAGDLVAMHRHCQRIFAAEGARYVQIVGGWSAIALKGSFPSYICPGLDVFADGYQYHQNEPAEAVFGPVANAIAKAGARFRGITETNSKYPAGRAAWFASGWQYAVAHRLETYFIWWSNRMPQFTWQRGDTVVIDELRKIRAASEKQ